MGGETLRDLGMSELSQWLLIVLGTMPFFLDSLTNLCTFSVRHHCALCGLHLPELCIMAALTPIIAQAPAALGVTLWVCQACLLYG